MATRIKSVFRTSLTLFAATITLTGGAMLVAAPAKPNWLLTFSLSAKGGHVIGNPAAPNKLVEYASYTCGHCAHFEIDQAPLVKNHLVATGQVSFEIRNLVRDAMDLTAAMVARCGGKGRFFGNHKLLMATQRQWDDESRLSDATIALLNSGQTMLFMQGAYTEVGLDQIMAQRGITPAQGKACLANKAAFDAIIAMSDEATGPLGMGGTPTFMVNGKIVEGYDFATLQPYLTK